MTPIVAVIVARIACFFYTVFQDLTNRFASSAVLALLHDVLVVLAFYAIARVSVGNTFIACMLTIVGYSINATIVIFDRIRENLHSGSREKLEKRIAGISITQRFTRSIYNSFTTFIMVAVLYVMEIFSSIREFAAPLMVGVLLVHILLYVLQVHCGMCLKKKFTGKGQPAIATASTAGNSSSKPKKARDVSQKIRLSQKKKNRKE